MATVTDVENCYRYILGRDMSALEQSGISDESVAGRELGDLRREFLRSSEFYSSHLETMFESLVPRSIPVLYHTSLGFKIYLDLRQLHISFGVLNEAYDRREIDLVRKIVPDNGVFFDVGANCGYYSLAVAAKNGFCGKIVAFEPLLPMAQLLAQSIAANGWSDRIALNQIALGHSEGSLPLTDAEFSINAGATRLAVGAVNGNHDRVVSVDTLDNVAKDIIPDVIKADIEGAEGLFLHGARETIQRAKPTLLFELNPELLRVVSNLAPGDLQNWLQKFQYRLWSIESDGLALVPADKNVGEMIGARGMQNFLAVHADRASWVSDSIGASAMLRDA